MILVNVFCAELRKSYDFKIDECAKVKKIVPEMVEMIIRSEQMTAGEKGFYLCVKENESILDSEKTLAEYGIGSGTSLLLV